MKKKHSLVLLSLLQIVVISMFFYSWYTYFSIEFDARDNYWPFARYFLTIYSSEIKFMLLSFTGLLLSIFIKNITEQSGGRLLVIFVNYLIKIIIALSLLSSLSGMYTTLNTNNFNAFLPISALIIPIAFILTFLVLVILIRETLTKFRNNN